MRIAIDGYNLAIPNGTGVATYGLSLAQTLQSMGHQVDGVFGLDVGNELNTRELLFFDALERDRRLKRKDKWTHIYRPMLRPWASGRLLEVPLTTRVEKRTYRDRLPAFSELYSFPWLFEYAHSRATYFRKFLTVRVPNPPDIMHWTYPVPIRMHGTRNIYTIHDLVPLRLPYATLDDKRLYSQIIEGCVYGGDHICTVSEASREDILDRFDIPASKVTNTYQSSPIPGEVADGTLDADAEMIKGLFGLERKSYFLFFGALDPKKNVERILDAYLSSGARMPLVMVVAKDWGMSKAGGVARDPLAGRDGSRIIRLNYLPRAMLFRLIRVARAVVFPSLFEGFGLPAFEAIQLGPPVIASNTGSLPEVVGDAGLQVDPYSVSDIAAAFKQMETDEPMYQRLLANGPAQADKFSQSRYEKRLTSMYKYVQSPGASR